MKDLLIMGGLMAVSFFLGALVVVWGMNVATGALEDSDEKGELP